MQRPFLGYAMKANKITDVEDKTATILQHVTFECTDFLHRAIVASARRLVRAGYGDATYVEGLENGTTVWIGSDGADYDCIPLLDR